MTNANFELADKTCPSRKRKRRNLNHRLRFRLGQLGMSVVLFASSCGLGWQR
jgi:hypothetical protein